VVPTMSNLNYDVSSTGTLAFVPASTSLSTLVWKDRVGHMVALPFSSRVYTFPALSPDGRRMTVGVTDWPEWNVFTGSVDREPLTRLTDGTNSLFSRDGKWIAFSSTQDGWFNLSRVRADGTGQPERLLIAAAHQKATSWSPSGDRLLFNEVGEEREAPNRNIAEVDVLHRRQRAFLSTPKSEIEAAFSPDGRWVAYQSDASGRWEIYVRAYTGEGPGRQVSIGGGMGPVWNPRGGELFYQTRTALMSVRVENGAALNAPTTLFAHRKSEDARREFDVAPDGDHFLFLEPATARAEINVITNWFEELKARVPVPRP
jgi:Tol biopolymer transport system component